MFKIPFKKEYIFKHQADIDQTDLISGYIPRNTPQLDGLQFYALQLFVKNFINTNTLNTRLMLNWHTGTGKTEAMFAIALEYIKQNEHNMVTVITKPELKKEFIKRLITNPEYEFITKAQLDYIKSVKDEESKEIYNSIRSKIYKKFNFIGYKKLVNNTFKLNGHKIAFEILQLFDTFDGDYISEAVRLYSSSIDFDFLKKIRGNLIFVDEAHHLYNSEKSNAYGITLKFIMDYLEDIPGQKTRLVLSTATIANGNPTEAIDMLNILIPNLRLKRDDYFRISNGIPVIKSKAKLEEIGKVSEGYISFLVDTNRSNYPTYEFTGVKYSDIPYFKFIECPMSKFQESTVLNNISSEIDKNKVNQFAQYDIAFPLINKTEIGTISQDGIKSIKNASNNWKILNKINFINNRFTGDFLYIDNIKKYSAKYYKMIQMLIDPKMSNKKIVVYHPAVHDNGVLLIGEILRKNGFIDFTETPNRNTLCSVCCVSNYKHSADHPFNPSRFVVLSSEISNISHYVGIYNSSLNDNGQKLKVVIGSRVIEEGLEFKHTSYQFLMSMPYDIPTMIQIFGRVIRNNSHIRFAPELRHVNLCIFLSVGTIIQDSIEYQLYKRKVGTYATIQEIERELRKKTINAFLLDQDTINTNSKSDSLFNGLECQFEQEPLNSIKLTQNIKLIEDDRYKAFYGSSEIPKIEKIMRSLFNVRTVWTYKDLLDHIRMPISNGFYNSKLFDENDVCLALYNLITNPSTDSAGKYRIFYVKSNDSTVKSNEDYYIKTYYKDDVFIEDIHENSFLLKPEKLIPYNVIDITDYIDSEIDNDAIVIQINKASVLHELNPKLPKMLFTLITMHKKYHKKIIKYIMYEKLGITQPNELKDIARLQSLEDFEALYELFNIANFKEFTYNTRNFTHKFDRIMLKWIKIDKKIDIILDNDIVTGYIESSNKKFNPIFKINISKSNTKKIVDKRLITNGVLCKTFEKKKLLKITDQLKVDVDKYYVMENICEKLAVKLLVLEYENFKTDDRKRWFYNFTEK